MGLDNLIIKDGDKPILVVSIHSCHAESKNSPRRRKEGKLTEDLNRELHEKLGYYSFIYTGFRSRCIRDTKNPLIKKIKAMRDIYEKIGVISLHGRGKKYTVKNYPNSIFELGTLNGKSLDFKIAANLWKKLSDNGMVFDYNVKFTGGAEIQLMHGTFNDKSYKKWKYSRYKPKKNKRPKRINVTSANYLQIAQLEFDDWKKDEDWIRNGVDRKFYVCKVLGDMLTDYISRPPKII